MDQALQPTRYAKNAVIFREGDPSESRMYDIADGIIGIYSNYGKDRQKLLTTLERGDCFGEMGLIEDLPRSATAVALQESVVLTITEETLEDYFRSQPGKILKIMRHMSERMRELSEDYRSACDAIADYLAAERAGTEKSPSLIERMRALASKRRR